jgi:hypothetical protein
MLGHSQTKGRATGNPNLSLPHRATSRLYPGEGLKQPGGGVAQKRVDVADVAEKEAVKGEKRWRLLAASARHTVALECKRGQCRCERAV